MKRPSRKLNVTAPVGQRIRCAMFGHDWRRVIGPRDGFYQRCRRCWVSKHEAGHEPTEAPLASARPHSHA